MLHGTAPTPRLRRSAGAPATARDTPTSALFRYAEEGVGGALAHGRSGCREGARGCARPVSARTRVDAAAAADQGTERVQQTGGHGRAIPPRHWRRPFRSVQRLVASLRAGQTGCLGRNLPGLRTGALGARLGEVELHAQELSGRARPAEGGRQAPLRRQRCASLLSFEGTGGDGTRSSSTAPQTSCSRTRTSPTPSVAKLHVLGNASLGVAVRPVIRRNRFHECG